MTEEKKTELKKDLIKVFSLTLVLIVLLGILLYFEIKINFLTNIAQTLIP